ncbi:MAG: hybrid sensor histidine kinase/response regulator [Polyangiaceae bacterium]
MSEEDLESPSILLVDDHAQNLLALEVILSPFGHRLVKAQSGEEALKALLQEDFALILLDVQMPGMDGFETAEMIRSRKRSAHIPIIFITAYHDASTHVHRGYEAGAVDYIVKPFDAAILRSKVSVFVDLYQKTRLIKQQARLIHDQQILSLELRYRNLTETLPIPIWADRENGETYYSNRAFLEYAGCGLAGARGLQTRAFVHPDDRAKIIFETERVRQPDAYELELRLRRADGEYRWHLLRSAREPDKKGRITIATDIHERRKAEDALAIVFGRERAARQKAEESDRSKDAFLATVSHELRTPLNAILGWAQLLMTGDIADDQRARAVETIERNAKAQSKLISDLFDVSRMMTGKSHLELKPCDLTQVVRDVIESLQPAILSKKIEIDLHIDDGGSPVVGDVNRLQQIFWNLLTNAMKFGADKVRIDLSRKNDAIALEVTDNGQGISAQFLPHVFDRFEQADAKTTRSQGGLGLGLSIVKHLVELHSGAVSVHSGGLGKGAKFTVTLPMAATTPASVSPEAAEKSVELAGANVLVVDDDEDGRALLAAILSRCGATVRVAPSIHEAILELEKQLPDVLLSDIGMPGADGYELIRHVRALQKTDRRLPAIALTAYSSQRDRERALREGFDDHLPKPVDIDALATTIERVMQHVAVAADTADRVLQTVAVEVVPKEAALAAPKEAAPKENELL